MDKSCAGNDDTGDVFPLCALTSRRDRNFGRLSVKYRATEILVANGYLMFTGYSRNQT
jgi:hypothetical protein